MIPSAHPERLAAAAAAEEAFRRAWAEAERLRKERNRAVRAALEHHTHAAVAKATGLTRGRIGQISLASDD